jgi:hypothetical protein
MYDDASSLHPSSISVKGMRVSRFHKFGAEVNSSHKTNILVFVMVPT